MINLGEICITSVEGMINLGDEMICLGSGGEWIYPL